MLTVVIPSHNRAESLCQVLQALSGQTVPANEFEVVVVADACSDGTPKIVRSLASELPYHLELISHEARSAARSRNLGAECARGEFLIFLDDDVRPAVDWLAAHRDALANTPVVIGYSSAVLPPKPSWWQLDARVWWEDRYREMRRPGHRFHYRDVFSGNLSMAKDIFLEIGGFDETFRRLEDYELGLRLLRHGVRIGHESRALGWHLESTDLASWLRRMRDEAHAEVQLAQQHPEFRGLFFGNLDLGGSRSVRIARWFATLDSRLGGLFETGLLHCAEWCERARLRRRWRGAIGLLREYNYWYGIREAVPRDRFSAWAQDGALIPPLADSIVDIELTNLPAQPARDELLDRATRNGARILVCGIQCLVLAPDLGAEPLRESHLRLALRDAARTRFLPALAVAWAEGSSPELHSC